MTTVLDPQGLSPPMYPMVHKHTQEAACVASVGVREQMSVQPSHEDSSAWGS